MKELTEKIKQLDVFEKYALLAILNELESAKKKHPEFPRDLVYGSAVVSEESGELVQACLQFVYRENENNPDGYNNITNEAAQVGAMGLRFLSEVIKPF